MRSALLSMRGTLKCQPTRSDSTLMQSALASREEERVLLKTGGFHLHLGYITGSGRSGPPKACRCPGCKPFGTVLASRRQNWRRVQARVEKTISRLERGVRAHTLTLKRLRKALRVGWQQLL